VKVAELKKIEQGGRTMEEFVQDFKRVARGSGYKGRPLIEEFKRCMNRSIRRKLMEAENQPATIEHWFKRAIALDSVVATTRHSRTNDLTTSKALSRAIK